MSKLLAQNISLLYGTASAFAHLNSENQGGSVLFDNRTRYTDENMYGDLSSILPIALHSMNGVKEGENEEAVWDGPLVSKRTRDIVVTINMAILSQIISVFGVVANIINIVVFIKQGFGEAMTVTLTGLAVADLGTVTCQVWLSICWNPWFNYERLNLPFRPMHVEYLSACHPRMSSVRVSAWILALVTFERCLCIAIPFKVREIITPYRARVFVIVVFVVNTACSVPFYYTSRIVPFFDSYLNRSYLVLTFTKDRQQIDNVFFAISASLTVISFLAVTIFTVVLVYSLDKASKWRESVKISDGTVSKIENGQTEQCAENADDAKKTQQPQPDKNKRAAKMVSLISTIFIACCLPNTVNQLVMVIVPGYAKNGGYVNISQTCWSVGYMTETINASINIFMYYTMSTRYRTTVQEMFRMRCFPVGNTDLAKKDIPGGLKARK